MLPFGSTIGIVLAGMALSLAAGLFFAWGPLKEKPAQVLRTAAG